MSSMSFLAASVIEAARLHPWLRPTQVAFAPHTVTPLLEQAVTGLAEAFRRMGHSVAERPTEETDVLFTTVGYGEVRDWREAPLFAARRRYGLRRSPQVYALAAITPAEFTAILEYFERVLTKEPPDPSDFTFDGMAPQSWQVLVEQGRRGGPILSLMRLMQSQSKTIRMVLLVGDDAPREAYHFDLVGAYPRTDAANMTAFYDDIALRVVTTVSTDEVTQHEVVGEAISADAWRRLATPQAMRVAGQQLGERGFFTNMIRIADLVQVPAVADSVARQYSEGCYATWDPDLDALIATVTGSARPVDKGNISDDDLAVIVGVRPDGRGARVRHVYGKANIAPSSESVELIQMDSLLPTVTLTQADGAAVRLPVVRSKLHGHRGISAYDPARVEFVPLDAPYYHYIVSCATQAQAEGIIHAFARSRALNHADDPRQVVFTVLPGHGTVIVEKWAGGKAPFQTIWEYVDQGALAVAKDIPQGPMRYAEGDDGRMHLVEDREVCR
ncbi:MAG: hypothetical protein V1772_01485 [Chloroflexota bacterium]